ncbi:GRB2-related adapter protein-like isoform X1 [Centropristis striata]|uniref:GRB2-related adapter protein-like isoform X1 n=1 Tax=Centropristis striata TaxID=184440 RepID=UPI0027E1B72F|nr:GRB2-related adapter protein-like isoform X1 [Centropristis striata]XP_059199282.1 GRB2-related adapter protein-like isoform X1 [Centropristis striata]
MEALALFSFTASEADEISFKKGDLIKVTEMEDDSCWVTAEIQGRRGYVPENYISLLPYSWFAGPVSRLEAEKRLRWQDTGVFLVRESESAPGEFSVSVSYGDRVEHFRVLEGGGQYCIWDESFCSLNRLVDFYRTHSIAVEKVVCLRDPPESPSLLSHPEHNPYPNPYKSSSQESLPSARLYSHPSHPQRESFQRLHEPVLGKPRLAHALCDYTPPHTAHLHFLRGDIIDLLDCSSSLTWRGRCRGRVGIFPPEYVQPLYH